MENSKKMNIKQFSIAGFIKSKKSFLLERLPLVSFVVFNIIVLGVYWNAVDSFLDDVDTQRIENSIVLVDKKNNKLQSKLKYLQENNQSMDGLSIANELSKIKKIQIGTFHEIKLTYSTNTKKGKIYKASGGSALNSLLFINILIKKIEKDSIKAKVGNITINNNNGFFFIEVFGR